MRIAVLAAAAATSLSLIAGAASAQGLSFPIGGDSSSSSSSAPATPYRPAVSPYRTLSLSEQWSASTNPPSARDMASACKDASTKQAEQSPTPPTAYACH